MGGNLMATFDEVKNRRMDKQDFEVFSKDIVGHFKSWVSSKVAIIPSYRTKRSHGDLDILVEAYARHTYDIHDVIRRCFNPVVVVQQKNSNVISFSHNSFQVDIIVAPPEEYDFSLAYFSYNDLGNFMGRIADAMGFKFGYQGLFYTLYNKDKSQIIDNILLTRDVETAFNFLGFYYERFQQGFDRLDEIFNYVIDSVFFNPNCFLLENRNNRDRTRDKKRKNYLGLLSQIKYRCETDLANSEFTQFDNPAFWILRAHTFFPDFEDECNKAWAKYEKKRALADKVNGELVQSLTGLKGKDLGLFLKESKLKEKAEAYIEEYNLSVDDFDAESFILSVYGEYILNP